MITHNSKRLRSNQKSRKRHVPPGFQLKQLWPVEPTRQLTLDVISWHKKGGTEHVRLVLSLLATSLPIIAMQNQVSKLVSGIEARSVTQTLVCPQGHNWPVRKINAEGVNFFHTDTEAYDNNTISLEQPDHVFNRANRNPPALAHLHCNILDGFRPQGPHFAKRHTRQIELWQHDVFFEFERKLPSQVHVSQRLLPISRQGGPETPKKSNGLLLSRRPRRRSKERHWHTQRNREATQGRLSWPGMSVLELTDRGRRDRPDLPGQLHLSKPSKLPRHPQPRPVKESGNVTRV